MLTEMNVLVADLASEIVKILRVRGGFTRPNMKGEKHGRFINELHGRIEDLLSRLEPESPGQVASGTGRQLALGIEVEEISPERVACPIELVLESGLTPTARSRMGVVSEQELLASTMCCACAFARKGYRYLYAREVLAEVTVLIGWIIEEFGYEIETAQERELRSVAMTTILPGFPEWGCLALTNGAPERLIASSRDFAVGVPLKVA